MLPFPIRAELVGRRVYGWARGCHSVIQIHRCCYCDDATALVTTHTDSLPPRLLNLSNRYFVMRHGHSKANERALIVSTPERGTTGFGLSERGRQEVAHTIEQHQAVFESLTKVYSSDFLRARQTAELVAAAYDLDVMSAEALRERQFGRWDGQSSEHYDQIWSADRGDPAHERWGVESVAAVAERIQSWLRQIDSQTDRQNILLVSHGDPLQILLVAVHGGDLRTHRDINPLTTAELRPLA